MRADVDSGSVRLSGDGLDGLSIRYSEAGRGPAVLLVHGNLAGRRWWRDVLENSAPGFRLIALDLPGFGESGVSGTFEASIPLYAEACLRLLDGLGLGHAVPVGHSMGGAVVMEMAAREPNRLPGAVLLDSAPPEGFRTLPHLHPFLRTLRTGEDAMRESLAQAMPTRRPPYLDDLVEEARMMHSTSFVGNAQALGKWDRREEMSRYERPVLVASGEKDRLIGSREIDATVDAFPRGRQAIIPETGHSPQIERPGLFCRLLENFLQTLADDALQSWKSQTASESTCRSTLA